MRHSYQSGNSFWNGNTACEMYRFREIAHRRVGPGLRLRPKNVQLSWLGLDALSLVGPNEVQLLEFCCSSVSVLVLLSSTHLGLSELHVCYFDALMSFKTYTPRKYWLITQEAVAPSRHDWKIVDWDVKPQHKQTKALMSLNSFTRTE